MSEPVLRLELPEALRPEAEDNFRALHTLEAEAAEAVCIRF